MEKPSQATQGMSQVNNRRNTREELMVRGRSIQSDEEMEIDSLLELIMPSKEEAVMRSQGKEMNLSIKKPMDRVYQAF